MRGRLFSKTGFKNLWKRAGEIDMSKPPEKDDEESHQGENKKEATLINHCIGTSVLPCNVCLESKLGSM